MSRLNAMRLTVSSTHFLKKMDEFAETFDTILDNGKQQGSEMLKKTQCKTTSSWRYNHSSVI